MFKNVESGTPTGKTTVTFESNVTIALDTPGDFTQTNSNITRRWKYANLFNKSPGQSQYQKNSVANAIQDEIHIVVIDRDGKFSGRAGEVLERWESLSRAEDAKNEIGEKIYYKHVINEQSRYIRIHTNYRTPTDYTSPLPQVWGSVFRALPQALI